MYTNKRIIEWILRIGVFGTFLGHGCLALSIKSSWIPLITVFGFSKETAIILLPVIGVWDILVAFLILLKPAPAFLIWATIWAFAAACSRIIAGESIWEFVERFSTWTCPVALLMLQEGSIKNIKNIFALEWHYKPNHSNIFGNLTHALRKSFNSILSFFL